MDKLTVTEKQLQGTVTYSYEDAEKRTHLQLQRKIYISKSDPNLTVTSSRF